MSDLDYGPLTGLIGTWKGDKGIDMAPEPDGLDENPYYETIIISPTAKVDNAETQEISALHYRQVVRRKSNDNIFHDQTGYWMWDQKKDYIIHSLAIPRGVCLLAGGTYKKLDSGAIEFEVSSFMGDKDWGIVESPFMRDNATTKSFTAKFTLDKSNLIYKEITIVDIYGQTFDHSDENALQLVK